MNANRISWTAAALDGWGQQRSSIVDVAACVTLSHPDTDIYLRVLLPVPLPDTMTEQVWAHKAIATHEEQCSWLELRQFCSDFHKTESKAQRPGSKGPAT